MHRIERSDAADTDLLDIWEYTYLEWDETQADRYLDKLELGFLRLLDNPKLGKPRDAYHSGLRSLIIEHHIAFYTTTPDIIRIERVLHKNMDVPKHIDFE